MSSLTEKLTELETQSSEDRFEYLLEQVLQTQEVWILTDGQGSVLLDSDGEECVPVWPHREAAELWIQNDWNDCSAQAIALTDWQARWTKGLRQDGMSIAVFPNQQTEAIVLSPDAFDDDLIAAQSQ